MKPRVIMRALAMCAPFKTAALDTKEVYFNFAIEPSSKQDGGNFLSKEKRESPSCIDCTWSHNASCISNDNPDIERVFSTVWDRLQAAWLSSRLPSAFWELCAKMSHNESTASQYCQRLHVILPARHWRSTRSVLFQSMGCCACTHIDKSTARLLELQRYHHY